MLGFFLFRTSNSEIAMTIETCGILYNMLLDLLDNITEFFFLPILLTLATNFLHIVAAINILYLILRKFQEMNLFIMNIIFYILMWILIIILEFYIVSHESDYLCKTVGTKMYNDKEKYFLIINTVNEFHYLSRANNRFVCRNWIWVLDGPWSENKGMVIDPTSSQLETGLILVNKFNKLKIVPILQNFINYIKAEQKSR